MTRVETVILEAMRRSTVTWHRLTTGGALIVNWRAIAVTGGMTRHGPGPVIRVMSRMNTDHPGPTSPPGKRSPSGTALARLSVHRYPGLDPGLTPASPSEPPPANVAASSRERRSP
ncbi:MULTISPECIES: hypothetical protein [unclassified Frankia]|uniref:hypothetical protein n=1 Tax=unclassified Frankia TaxID=2632575 RepID=UPI002AD24089|nr:MULTISPECIES: hypothetical protein [unclassified Frankia]